MRRILLTASLLAGLLFTSFNGLAQQKSYRIFYDVTFEYKINLDMMDSATITGNAPAGVVPAEMLGMKIIRPVMTVKAEGNKSKAIITQEFPLETVLSPESRDNWPDSAVYENNHWTRFRGTVAITKLDTQSGVVSKPTFRYTDSTKTILGYRCSKVVISLTNGAIIDAWFTTDLPASLMPIPYYTEMKGAVLELEDHNAAMHYVATSVKEID
ncbi:MAG: hypothetical protein EOP54_27050 [Sphingobacteriales bacterium]|nr:MAG: hypothetical protein EOP54_27050 [Sphingobacteriales bacterium]